MPRASWVAAGAISPAGEPATGATLFMDTVLDAMPAPQPAQAHLCARRHRRRGGARHCATGTKAGSQSRACRRLMMRAAEARRLGCGHVFVAGAVASVE